MTGSLCLLCTLAAAAAAAPTPLSLPDAQAMALRNHPQVAIARLEELVARERLSGAQAAYFPTAQGYFDAVDAGNRNTRIMAGGLNNPSIYDRVAEGVSVTQLITDFGRTANLIGAQRLQAKAEAEQGEATSDQILLNVDANYFAALQADAVLQVAAETIRTRGELAGQVGQLAQHQLKSELDVSFAQVALAQGQLLQQSAQNQLDGAMAGLSAAVGLPRARTFILTAPAAAGFAPPDVDAVIDEALRRRPDILRLQYQRDAAQRLARAERDRNYPSLSAVGTIGNAFSHDYRLPNHYAAGGVQMDIPLFAGGAYVARAREARLQADAAEQELRDREDNASRDIRQAWLNLNTARARLQTSGQLLRHANQAFTLAQARYRVGSSGIVELSQAQLAATQAQIGEATARYDVLIQEAVLRYQMGEPPR